MVKSIGCRTRESFTEPGRGFVRDTLGKETMLTSCVSADIFRGGGGGNSARRCSTLFSTCDTHVVIVECVHQAVVYAGVNK